MDWFDVFLSYSTQDRTLVQELSQMLDQANLRVWIDEEQIEYGRNILDGIEEGLAQSRFLFACLSPSFATSKWCQTEYRALLKKEIDCSSTIVIPVELVACKEKQIPTILYDKKRVNPWDSAQFARLVKQIRNASRNGSGS